MMVLSELFLLVCCICCVSFASFDSLVHSPMSGNKYVNTVKKPKDDAQLQEEDVSVRWPNGIVRYYVDNRSYDFIFGNVLKSAIRLIHRRSCIIFEKLYSKPMENFTWIHLTNPRKERECNHKPRFLDNGEIELIFGYDCLKTKELLHTLLHGVGFKDEVTHPQRDKYLRVLWDNIHPGFRHLYRKQVVTTSKNLVEYDPSSVMHFHDRAFSRNGRATIVPLESGFVISPSETLSQLDMTRLQTYFGDECNKRKVSALMQTCEKSPKGKKDSKESTDYAVGNVKHTIKHNKTQREILNAKNREMYAKEYINPQTEEEVFDSEKGDPDESGKDGDSEGVVEENYEKQIEGDQGRVRLDSENNNKKKTLGKIYEENHYGTINTDGEEKFYSVKAHVAQSTYEKGSTEVPAFTNSQESQESVGEYIETNRNIREFDNQKMTSVDIPSSGSEAGEDDTNDKINEVLSEKT